MHWPVILITSKPNTTLAIAWFIVNALAVFRLSRIIAHDRIMDKPRHYMNRKYTGSIVNLLTCMWCLSFWFACMAVVLMLFESTRPIWLLTAIMLSLSAVSGMLSERFT